MSGMKFDALKLTSGREVSFSDNNNSDRTDNLPEFEMQAYTGSVMEKFGMRVVLSLNGMKVGRQKRPILLNHDRDQIVGHSLSITKNESGVNIGGVISGTGEAAKRIIETSRNGFPWQASLGLSVPEGKDGAIKVLSADDDPIEVNGTEFSGPGIAIMNSTVVESSFTPLGADDDTSAIVFSRNGTQLELATFQESVMAKATDHEQHVDVEALKDEARKTAQLELADTRKQLVEAFPDRPGFVLQQIELSHSLSEAKADLSEILLQENKQLKLAASRFDAEKHATEISLARETETEAVSTGINISLGELDQIGPDENAPIEERAEWDWQRDAEGCQRKYRSQKSYMAVRRAIDSGQLHVRGNTVVQLNG